MTLLTLRSAVLPLSLRSITSSASAVNSSAELRALANLGNYVPATRSGSKIYLAGHLPYDDKGTLLVGKVGQDLNVKEGYFAAQQAGLGLISTLNQELGSLTKVSKILHVRGLVNCTPDFLQHPSVINGCSDLLVKAFGLERGKHARVAYGVSSLPFGVAVEVEMIVEAF
ncbi:Endoribonuclease L-PSP/chorismate mutase-like protein [Paraphysoderma sedebokerense]|nr:Endoribonuclease L-PSP/chorismate mutase-like protein [Paraphysoderma sedebokerense]